MSLEDLIDNDITSSVSGRHLEFKVLKLWINPSHAWKVSLNVLFLDNSKTFLVLSPTNS